MKNISILILLTLISNASYAQDKVQKHNLHIGYIKSYYGKQFSLNYSRIIKKHSFSIGISYLRNPDYFPDAENYAFKHRFFAYTFSQHLIPNLQYARFIRTPFLKYEKPYLFINAQLIASGRKLYNILPKGAYFDSLKNQTQYLYIKDTWEDKSINYGINSCLGIGLLSNIATNFIVNIQCGFSNAAINYKIGTERNWASIEFATFFQLSVGYSFNTKNSNTY